MVPHVLITYTEAMEASPKDSGNESTPGCPFSLTAVSHHAHCPVLICPKHLPLTKVSTTIIHVNITLTTGRYAEVEVEQFKADVEKVNMFDLCLWSQFSSCQVLDASSNSSLKRCQIMSEYTVLIFLLVHPI